IVCEEENYLLELIRYIHLNPLRAGLVNDIDTLNRYQWCGHSVLMGKHILNGQVKEEVLARFGKNQRSALDAYLQFITEGVDQGRRPELVGGGMRRSQGGAENKDSKPESYDDRILGSGVFVEELRREENLREKLICGMQLPELMQRVERYYALPPGQLEERRRNRKSVEARDVFCYAAVRYLMYSGTETGKLINIKRSAVSHAIRRGKKVISENPNLLFSLFL
ncbi:MAG: transposase, partial [Desulfobulbaceae bacterium]|nr:transposase [Desulfobulbaceae bacterium]